MKEHEKVLIRCETYSRIYYLFRDTLMSENSRYGVAYEAKNPWSEDNDIVYLCHYADVNDAVLYLSFCLGGLMREKG